MKILPSTAALKFHLYLCIFKCFFLVTDHNVPVLICVYIYDIKPTSDYCFSHYAGLPLSVVLVLKFCMNKRGVLLPEE